MISCNARNSSIYDNDSMLSMLFAINTSNKSNQYTLLIIPNIF